ncbi:hypothetical protein O6P43_001180 [Quillaja saponaria]|uniref:Uncharacterized protein n=1 Tax=Quillaja saponaria TaxID=32244 RepID=A0AAD7VNN3_QUISA|nr:hypothetical protein O6P43_001180 [Quillaja saponaria]
MLLYQTDSILVSLEFSVKLLEIYCQTTHLSFLMLLLVTVLFFLSFWLRNRSDGNGTIELINTMGNINL